MWLTGPDYLECPTCWGDGTVEVHQHRIKERHTTIYIQGLRPVTIAKLPTRSLIDDSLIIRID